MFAGLQTETAFRISPAHGIRHPMIFYYGHVATLYINKLRVAGVITESINPHYEDIFETGVDEMSWDDLSKNEMNWPSVTKVHEYRSKVYKVISDLISNLTDNECKSITKESPLWALVMSFEHERIHIETSSVLINELPIHLVLRPEYFPKYYSNNDIVNQQASEQSIHQAVQPVVDVDYPKNEFIYVESQTIKLGKPENYPSYGWDNEYGTKTMNIPSFKATKYQISNGEYHEFVSDNGYANNQYWSDDGWKWRSFRNTKVSFPSLFKYF